MILSKVYINNMILLKIISIHYLTTIIIIIRQIMNNITIIMIMN